MVNNNRNTLLLLINLVQVTLSTWYAFIHTLCSQSLSFKKAIRFFENLNLILPMYILIKYLAVTIADFI